MTTKTVDIADAEHQLAELVDSAAHGEEVFLTRNNVPLAKIVAVAPVVTTRVFGLHQNQTWIADDFDAPIGEDFWAGSKGS